ncbi:MAG: STAS domain-containing protein [Bacillota bacterium]
MAKDLYIISEKAGDRMAQLTLAYEDGIMLARITGEVTLLYSNELKCKIKEELAKTNTDKVIIDLSKVPLLDSSGLGMLISLFKYINEEKGQIVYAGLTDYVKKIVGFAKLDKIFTIVDSVESGMQLLKENK